MCVAILTQCYSNLSYNGYYYIELTYSSKERQGNILSSHYGETQVKSHLEAVMCVAILTQWIVTEKQTKKQI